MTSGEVRINNGVLWIDSEAYPLRTISHVGSRWIDPKPIKTAAVRKFILRALLCLMIAGIAGSASSALGLFVFLGGMALAVWRLALALKLQPLYGLVLNTAGVQHDAIWSMDQNEIGKLVEVITDAIGHPDTAQTIFNVNHVVGGDIIQQYGANNIGKQVGAGVKSH
ncbi:DUF6232 family protein [Kutzneria sp. CA-103260]|uniref:DUF6232 family protein n=1 Tax=Kutzneria sp. CA-103260 TaxID=2802641 RepID=UPI001BA66ADF|nr:DUF6232 family protein [Kutzneria sp. CA-103260]QUQ69375.1 hypothetical protein JJ691_71330 [Kutzneria sp. CA-103260]